MTTDFDCNVATPLAGGPSQIRLVVCEDDGDGGFIEGCCVEVVIPRGGQGDGNPGPGDGGDGGGGGGGGDDDDDEETPEQQLDEAVADALEKLESGRSLQSDTARYSAHGR